MKLISTSCVKLSQTPKTLYVTNVNKEAIRLQNVELGIQKIKQDWHEQSSFNLSKSQSSENTSFSNSKTSKFLLALTLKDWWTISCSFVSWWEMISCPICHLYKSEKVLWMLF